MYLFFPVAVYAIFVYLLRKSQAGWRDSTLCGAAIWGFALFVITELLSISKHLTLWPVVISWALIGAGVYLASKWGLALDGDFRSEQISVENNPYDPMGFVWPAILVFFFLAITCLVAAPNTSDAMRYHMPRVVYWFEYKSIAHYAAVEYCQLQMPPFAEFAMLHAFILAKGDRFVGFIQFFGFLGSAVAGSVIGAGGLAWVSAALVAALHGAVCSLGGSCGRVASSASLYHSWDARKFGSITTASPNSRIGSWFPRSTAWPASTSCSSLCAASALKTFAHFVHRTMPIAD